MSIVTQNIEYGILNMEWIYSKFKIQNSKFHPGGFTLIELMISISIMGILTGVLFANYPDSTTRIGLSNTNHKIALLLREAQVRGSSVDSKSSTVSGYGVYASSTDPTTLILFSDFANNSTSTIGIVLGDGLYNKAPIDEKSSTLKLLQNFYISNLCVKTNGTLSCSKDVPSSVTDLTISFTRPNPRPHIYINSISPLSIPTPGIDYDEACIEISSPKAPLPGHIRSIKVNNTGFISTLIGRCT